MLVLTRKAEQTIHIGRNITVTILRIKGRTVKVGIQAPSVMEVLRGELIAEQPSPREGSSERAAASGPSAEVPAAQPSRSRRAPRNLLPPGTPPSPGVGPALLIQENVRPAKKPIRFVLASAVQ